MLYIVDLFKLRTWCQIFHPSKKNIFRQLHYSNGHLQIKRAPKWVAPWIRFKLKTSHSHSFEKTHHLLQLERCAVKIAIAVKFCIRSWLRFLAIYCFLSAVLSPHCRLLWTKPAVLQVRFDLCILLIKYNEQVQLEIMSMYYILTLKMHVYIIQ